MTDSKMKVIESEHLRELLERKDEEIKYLKGTLLKYISKFGNGVFCDDDDTNLAINCNVQTDSPTNVKSKTVCSCSCHCEVNADEVYTNFDVGTQTFETDFCFEVSGGSTEDWKPPEGTNMTVTDLVREVAEENYGQTDYVYDENSKMYYSPSTGYYFDKEQNLLYDPNSGIYYKYDVANNTYEFYCQVSVNNNPEKTSDREKENQKQEDEQNNCQTNNSEKQVKRCRRKKRNVKSMRMMDKGKYFKNKRKQNSTSSSENTDSSNDNEQREKSSSLEEGEVTPSLDSSFSESSDDKSLLNSPESFAYSEESLEKWPPGIRAIVQESTDLQIGSLLLITCTGGIIGREKSNSIYIPDLCVSKEHAEIVFDSESWQYGIKDLGSQNGTFVNNSRLSEPKEQSSLYVLNHGDYLHLGTSFKLLLHIHSGGDTCDDCEPGQIQAELANEGNSNDKETCVVKTKEEREKERRQQLRQIKKKFGLQNMAYVGGNASVSKSQGYQDRAKERRKIKGSQNPYEKDAAPATLDTSLTSSNKGFQMLKKMGWSEGSKLGSNETGLLEPIPLSVREGKSGLGSVEPQMRPVPEDRRLKKWRKAQKRYQQLEQSQTTAISEDQP